MPNNIKRLRIYKKINVTPLPDHKYIVNKDIELFDVFIPSGYVTNGADIPRVFWSIIPPNDSMVLPAVILHDFLCTVSNMIFEITGEKKLTFEKADALFLSTLKSLGVSDRRISIYKTVKIHTGVIRPMMLKYRKPFIYERNRRLINKYIKDTPGMTLSKLSGH